MLELYSVLWGKWYHVWAICCIADPSTSLHLQREESVRNLVDVNDHDVPIMINKLSEGFENLDVAAKQVSTY